MDKIDILFLKLLLIILIKNLKFFCLTKLKMQFSIILKVDSILTNQNKMTKINFQLFNIDDGILVILLRSKTEK